MTAAILDSWRLAGRRIPARAQSLDGVRVVEIGGARLRLQDIGSGPPIVVVPDPPNLIDHHVSLNERLARGHRVVCFEPPAFGYSRPSRGFGFTISEQADVIANVLAELDLRDVTLSLSCLGSFAALLVAQAHPGRVSRLILGQVPSLDESKEWMRRVDFHGVIGTPWLGQLVLWAMPRVVARNWYRVALPRGADTSAYAAPALRALAASASFSLASAFQAYQRAELPELRLSQRIDVLWGDADRSHRGTNPRSILDLLPTAHFHVRTGCGHFPDLEAPDAFADLVGRTG